MGPFVSHDFFWTPGTEKGLLCPTCGETTPAHRNVLAFSLENLGAVAMRCQLRSVRSRTVRCCDAIGAPFVASAAHRRDACLNYGGLSSCNSRCQSSSVGDPSLRVNARSFARSVQSALQVGPMASLLARLKASSGAQPASRCDETMNFVLLKR